MPGVTSVQWSADGPPRSELPGSAAVMRHVAVKAGHVAARHHHEFEQFLYVASGDGLLQSEAGAIPLRPGTALRLEAGAWHSAEFTSDTVLIELNLK